MTKRSVGRPARISRAQIADAANEIGLRDLTLRAVADRLGVSIASLYHHVDSKDDLVRMAAEQSVARTPIPEDRGQDWRTWLREWAIYNHSAFVADPELLGQYMEGAIAPEVVAQNMDLIRRVLVREGFGPDEADVAYQVIASCAVGAAVRTIRHQWELRTHHPAAGPAPVAFTTQAEIVIAGVAAGRED